MQPLRQPQLGHGSRGARHPDRGSRNPRTTTSHLPRAFSDGHRGAEPKRGTEPKRERSTNGILSSGARGASGELRGKHRDLPGLDPQDHRQ